MAKGPSFNFGANRPRKAKSGSKARKGGKSGKGKGSKSNAWRSYTGERIT
jgi:hypothetical protein